MINKITTAKTVYLSTQAVDMRKSINGLTAIVQGAFQIDPYNECTLFVFSNKQHNKIKVLQWDKDGFILYYKRREQGHFQWPSVVNELDGTVNITSKDLKRLLDGLVMEQFVPHVNYNIY